MLAENSISLARKSYLKEYKGSKMKKLVVVIGVVCAGLIAPKVIGTIVENKYDSIASRFVDHPSLEITQRSFSTDWFSGQSITKMKFKEPSAEVEGFEVTINEEFAFGPVIFADNDIHFALSHSNIDVDFEVLGVNETEQENINAFITQLNDKLFVSSTISYGLNYKTAIKMDATSFEEDGEQINLGAMDSEFTVTDEKYIDGYLNWTGLDFKGPEAHVQVSALAVTFNQEMINGDIYSANALALGDFSSLIKNITAQDANGDELLNIENLVVSGSSKLKEELMKVTLHYGIEHFEGSGQILDKLNLDVSFDKLNPDVLLELNELAAKMQQEPENSELISQQIMSTAAQLLATNPEIKINDLSAMTPDGVIKSDLQLIIDHTLYNQANPMSIIAALKANSKGVAPLAFFQKLGMDDVVNMYLGQGFIEKKADELSFSATFERGQLMLNGQMIAL